MSYTEYLAAEHVGELKHEYLAGEVWAMAGGTPEHARLAATLIRLIGGMLQGRPCEVFTSDLRIRIDATDLSTYPDVAVVCGKLETSAEDPHAVTNPVLLVEVLSETTERYDRGEKAAHYRRIPSLDEYLLVSSDRSRIELYRRKGDHWEFFEAAPGERLNLATLDAALEVDRVYENKLVED